MSTDRRPEGQNGRARGTVPLSAVDAQRRHAVGYEFGCPGAATHLSLRFRDKPATGIDGNTFPAAMWEQSPKFTLPNQSILLAGVGAFTTKVPFLSHPSANPEFAELDRARWKAALSTHMNVTAEWFVLHDTGGGAVPSSAGEAEGRDGGVHMFMDQQRVFLHNDFSGPHGGATRFEKAHHEFRPRFVHVELAYPPTAAELVEARNARREGREPRGISIPNPPAPPSGYNFDALALAYIFASYRAGRWLTVTCHLEVDRGIPGAHHDPRGFRFATFYRKIITFMGASSTGFWGLTQPVIPFPFPGLPTRTPPASTTTIPAGSTFGILDARIGDNQNQASYANTFPAQYGPVLNKSQIVCVPPRTR